MLQCIFSTERLWSSTSSKASVAVNGKFMSSFTPPTSSGRSKPHLPLLLTNCSQSHFVHQVEMNSMVQYRGRPLGGVKLTLQQQRLRRFQPHWVRRQPAGRHNPPTPILPSIVIVSDVLIDIFTWVLSIFVLCQDGWLVGLVAGLVGWLIVCLRGCWWLVCVS